MRVELAGDLPSTLQAHLGTENDDDDNVTAYSGWGPSLSDEIFDDAVSDDDDSVVNTTPVMAMLNGNGTMAEQLKALQLQVQSLQQTVQVQQKEQDNLRQKLEELESRQSWLRNLFRAVTLYDTVYLSVLCTGSIYVLARISALNHTTAMVSLLTLQFLYVTGISSVVHEYYSENTDHRLKPLLLVTSIVHVKLQLGPAALRVLAVACVALCQAAAQPPTSCAFQHSQLLYRAAQSPTQRKVLIAVSWLLVVATAKPHWFNYSIVASVLVFEGRSVLGKWYNNRRRLAGTTNKTNSETVKTKVSVVDTGKKDQ